MSDLEGVISGLKGEQKKQAERTQAQLDELLSNTAYLSALREDSSGDIVKEVERHLSRTPADIQSAQFKIRSCIELYCRFVKGIKLTDHLLFPGGEKVYKKFASANVSEFDDELVNIYSDTNGYIHTENEMILMSDAERKRTVDRIRENARKLHDWKVDQYDIVEGIKKHYVTRDKMLLEMLEDGRIDKEFVEKESHSRSNLKYFFDEGSDIEDALRKLNADIPSVRFRSIDDVKDHLGMGNNIAEHTEATKPQAVKTEAIKPAPIIGNQKGRRESVILKYFPDRKYGFIRNPDRPNDPNGIHFEVRGNDRGYERGAKVSFVMGRNYKGT